jgi:hypothetical protein
VAAASLAAGTVLMAMLIVPIVVFTRRAPAAQLADPTLAAIAPAPAETESTDPAPTGPQVWRVSSLSENDALEVVEGKVGKHPIVNALGALGVPKGEVHRVMMAFERVHKLERCSAGDAFTFAKDKKTGRVVAFELEASPVDIWQAIIPGIDGTGPRGDVSSPLECKKVELNIQRKKIAVAVSVTDDVRADIVKAGLDDDIVKLLDDALEGHAEVTSLRKGSRLRIVATEDTVDGAYRRYAAVDAVEYLPPRQGATSLRVYYYVRGCVPDEYDEDEEAKDR